MNELIKKEIYKVYPELNPQDPRSPYYVRILERNHNILKEFVKLILSFMIISIFNIILLRILKYNLMNILIFGVLIVRYPIKRLLILMIKTYQNYSPDHIRNRCRFEPSCSQYALKSINQFILPIALYKIGNRLYRCSFTQEGGFEDI